MQETDRGGIAGVLFDIDDTLIDLETAMGHTLQHIGAELLSHLDASEWLEYKRIFARDPQGYYDLYLSGHLSFAEQRIRRVRYSHACLGLFPLGDEQAEQWHANYEQTLPRHFAPFDDVLPLLDALDVAGIPYGAVSNNVESYQRTKLDTSGLTRMTVLVGIDTVDSAKPDAAIFLEGARQIGCAPARTLYVGDNRTVDAVGATDAGLIGLWLNRSGSEPGDYNGGIISGLAEVIPRYLPA